jgi:tetratricopeptide (TPR) repeat protein
MRIAGIALIAALAFAPAAFADETPSAMLEKGIFQEETAGNLDAAVKVYKQIVDEANANRRFVAEAQFRIGECYQKQGKKAEAEAAFRQVIASYSDHADLVAKAHKELGEAEPARAPKIVSTSPAAFATDVSPALDKITVTFDQKMKDGSWSWTGSGDTFPKVEKPHYDAAKMTCTLPCKLQPGKVYWVGINAPSFKNFRSAEGVPAPWYIILFATQSADGKPTPIPADLLEQARPVNAQSVILSADDKERKAAESLAAEGWRLWFQRKLPEAEAKFGEAVKLDPANVKAWNGMGWAQMNQGKTLNARESFEKCVALDLKAAAAMNGLGWIANGEGKTDEAMGWWKKAIEASPNTTAALSGLAATSMELKQYDQAAQYYQMWLKAEPDNADAKLGLDKAKTAAQSVKAATQAVEQWLAALDAGKYADCWEQSAAAIRKTVPKANLEAALKTALQPFGKVVSRKLLAADYETSLPGAPNGEYVIMQYQTDFESKKGAIETITPTKEADGQWRVSGYYVK